MMTTPKSKEKADIQAKLDEMKAKFDKDVKAQQAKDKVDPKPKTTRRGRKPKETPEEKEKKDFIEQTTPTPEFEVMVGKGMASIFDVIAARKGDHWALLEREEKAMGHAWGRLILKYGDPYKWIPEIGALICTIAISKRIGADEKKAKEQQQ